MPYFLPFLDMPHERKKVLLLRWKMVRQSEDGRNDDDAWWDPIFPFPLDSIQIEVLLFDDEVVAYKKMPLHPMTRKMTMRKMESQYVDELVVVVVVVPY